MDGNYIKAMYKRWLLHKVLIDCWTTLKCAKEIGANPSEVQRDFDSFLKERAKG